MKNTEIQKLLDQISQALVFEDESQVDILQDLPEAFGELGAMVRELGREEEAEFCHQALSLSVQVLDGVVDWAEGCRVLVETVNALSACLNDDCSSSEAGFPQELTEGLPQEEPTASAPEGASEEPTATEEAKAKAESEPEPCGLVDDAIVGEFLSRQIDILQDVEKQLLNIESGEPGDEKWLMRFYHTLKGESALLGMTQISEVCHATEDMVQKCSVTACVEKLLEVNDWFRARINHLTNGSESPESLEKILEKIQSNPEHGSVEDPAEDPVPEVAAEDPAPTPDPTPVPTPASPKAQPEVVPVSYEVVEYAGKNILEGDVDLLQDFVEEAVEHLDAAEVHLLTIEADPKECEALNAVFRGFHTIKGLAGFIELDHVKDLAHKAENLLDMARRDELELVGDNMDAVFESVDMMKRLVTAVTAAMGGDGIIPEESNLAALMGRLVALTSDQPPEAKPAVPEAADPEPRAVVETVPEPEPVGEVAAEPEPVVEVDSKTEAVTAAPQASGFIPLGNMKKKKPAEAAKPVSSPEPSPEIKPEASPVMAPTPSPAPAKPPTTTAASPAAAKKAAKAPVKVKEAVRVDSERLDRLIETIGELVIAESMVTQSNEMKNTNMSVKLAKDVDHLDKICRELQEIGMSLRMVPVRPVFQKMARLVRDLSKKTGRKVDFVMNGEDTELDKNVVDKIGDPLVHMVRNSVDHGIEPDSAERVAAGKSEKGRVELRAFHKGGNICIEIEDDGRGLNKDAILEKAISRGLVREGENLSDREIFNMIFEAGFSTAKQVTEVSGRGVGMDVVRRNIEELRGTVEINSEVGKGSTFTIKLPLTLAIIEGMVIMVGQEHYIIPTLSVVRLIRPRPEDITHVFDKGEMLAFEGEHLPLFRLSGLFDVKEAKTSPHEGTVVVVEEEGKKVGLMADDLLGQQSIVIKSLGETVQGTDGVAGGAIMSDGNVALILDIAGIVRVAHKVDTTKHVIENRNAGATLDTEVVQAALPEPGIDSEVGTNEYDITAVEAVVEEETDPVPLEV